MAGVAVLIAGAVAGAIWYRSRPLSTAAIVKRLPTRDALVLYIDFDALRRAGVLKILDSSSAGEDADYRRFVEKTQFDYRRDLDSAVVSFAPTGKYMLVRGRFDWSSLHRYARDQGGNCVNAFCRMQGSQPDRQISFFRLQSGLMGLAVSTDDYAARRLSETPSGPDPEIPAEPVWLSVPASLLRSGESLPPGTRMFARSIAQADSVVLAFAPEGNRLAARLDVRCRSDRDASDIAGELSRATAMLRDMIEREHQKPNPADLSGVLTSGTFRSEGTRVIGHWPIEKSFIENVLSGGA